MKRFFLLTLALCALYSAAAQDTITVTNSDADEIVHLWDNNTAKYSNNMEKDEIVKKKFKVYNTSSADLYIFTPPKEKATGYSVVIYPGGGYGYLSFPNSFPVWLREKGITAVVVKYRLPNYGHIDAMLEDAVGAIDYLRANAEKYNIDPQKVGVCGNSAGGHLAAWISNYLPDGQKPAFAILVYGAMERNRYYNTYTANSRLAGKRVTTADAEALSVSTMVTPTTPPTIMFLSDDDDVVAPYSSTIYYKTLKQYGVKASLHIYPSGGHGWSGRLKWPYRQQWLEAIEDWIEVVEKNNKK